MITLEDALNLGRGVERPFNCPSHADFHASASVNVNKGVWHCYTCGANGKVDGKRVPTDAELEAMLRPEKAARVYPPSWSTLFDCDDGYWASRFPQWVCWFVGFGQDPVDDAPTFPVFTPQGRLAGVGRRYDTDAKYRYPYAWSASRVLGLAHQGAAYAGGDVIALVEGVADGAALWEVGVPAFPCYGAGLHYPQREMVCRLNPKLILTGFDADAAGTAAAERADDSLADVAEIARVNWMAAIGKDPADITPAERLDVIGQTVAGTTYGADQQDLTTAFAARVDAIRTAYVSRKE